MLIAPELNLAPHCRAAVDSHGITLPDVPAWVIAHRQERADKRHVTARIRAGPGRLTWWTGV